MAIRLSYIREYEIFICLLLLLTLYYSWDLKVYICMLKWLVEENCKLAKHEGTFFEADRVLLMPQMMMKLMKRKNQAEDWISKLVVGAFISSRAIHFRKFVSFSP